MKQELVQLQPKLEAAKVDNANMMKVELYIMLSFYCKNVHMHQRPLRRLDAT